MARKGKAMARRGDGERLLENDIPFVFTGKVLPYGR